MMELNLLSNGQRAFRGYDHIFLGRGGSGSYFAPSAGGRSSRKVRGGMGAALLSENRVRRGGQMLRRGGKRMWLFRGGRSRKVGGESRN
jgi:hypothetical protein